MFMKCYFLFSVNSIDKLYLDYNAYLTQCKIKAFMQTKNIKGHSILHDVQQL